jgi:hypothetical protein
MAADRPTDRPSDAARTDAGSPTTPDTPPTTATWPLLDTRPTTATWPLLERPAFPPPATESRWERWGTAAPDAVVVAQAVGRFEAVRKSVREAVGMAIAWGMVVGVFGMSFWSDATLLVAIAATITVVVFVVRTVGWPEATRVEVHPHEIVTEAVWWWRKSPTRVAIGFDEITSVDLDYYEDGRETPEGPNHPRAAPLRDPRGPGPRRSSRNRPAARHPWPRPHHRERRHPNPPRPRRVRLADILIGLVAREHSRARVANRPGQCALGSRHTRAGGTFTDELHAAGGLATSPSSQGMALAHRLLIKLDPVGGRGPSTAGSSRRGSSQCWTTPSSRSVLHHSEFQGKCAL